MRRLFYAIPLLIIFVALPSLMLLASPPTSPPPEPISQPAEVAVCASICGKSGINTAYPVRQEMDEYERARSLRMGWVMEIAYNPTDLERTIEAINRAHDHNLEFVLRICAGSVCEFSDPNVYAQFLWDISAGIDGEFWALMGPNEPELEPWAGSKAVDVAAYMNAVMDQVDTIPNLKMVSPAFNLTNSVTHRYFNRMENAGARFTDLDAFSGTTYTIAGNGAYYYYANNSGHGEKMRQKAIRFGKPFIFVEYGTFNMFNKPGEDNPKRAKVVTQMKNEFRKAANDPTVMVIMHFDTFGINGGGHLLYDPEIIEITRDTDCIGSSFYDAGIGISTEQTLWQLSGETTCREILTGCPFDAGAVACPAGSCMDTDGDGQIGIGGDAVCVPTDCDDTDPAFGADCSGGVADSSVAWGTLHTVEGDVYSNDVAVWPIIKLRDDGMPVIAYHNATLGRGDLNLLDCTTADCSTAIRRVLVYQNRVGTFVSMQIRQDGVPVIAYFDETDDDFELYICTDGRCETGFSRIIDYDTGHYGFDTSIALRTDGHPLIAYWHSSFQDLRVYDCADHNCLTGTIRPLASANQVGNDPTVILGADYLPLIAFSWADAEQLRLFKCTLVDCSTGNDTLLNDINPGGFPTHAMTLRQDGRPAILFRKVNNEKLKLYDCADADCTSGVSPTIYDGGLPIQTAAIIALTDDTLFIAFEEEVAPGDTDLVLLRCLDLTCSTTAITRYATGNVGYQPSIALRANGYPVVAFHNRTDGTIMLYDVDLSTAPGGIPIPVPILVPPPAWTATLPAPTLTPTATPTATPPHTISVPLGIDDLQTVVVDDGIVAQVTLTISGKFSVRCGGRVVIDEVYNGNTITVDIYREQRYNRACSATADPYDVEFTLSQPLDMGIIYIMFINGVTVEIDLS